MWPPENFTSENLKFFAHIMNPSHTEIFSNTDLAITSIENRRNVLSHASVIVNDILHEEIKKIASVKDSQESDPNSLNIEQSISEFNPLLWEFFAKCTPGRVLEVGPTKKLKN